MRSPPALVELGDHCRLAYRIEGPERAPPLILSNSLGTTMDMWKPQLGLLTRHYRVVRYDTRGHGESDVPRGAYSLDRLGRDVIEMMDALSLDQAAFCGLSLGGMIGQWLGVRAPERLTRLILANTSAYMGPPSGWQDRMETVQLSGMQAIADAVLNRWFTPVFRSHSPDSVAQVRDMLLRTSPEGYVGCCAAIRDMDQRPTARLINVETVVAVGNRDPATPPEHGFFLAAQIPGASLARLDAAHLSNVEQPEKFSGLLVAGC